MLATRAEREAVVVELIRSQAGEVISSYEADDAGRHWRTRRGGGWGYLHELATRVANRIFPRVADELMKQTGEFSGFVDRFKAHLQNLSDEAKVTAVQLEIGDELQLDVAGRLEAFLEETLGSLQEMVQAEETRIVALLDNFIDDEVAGHVDAARERVAGIWGRGTTAGQTAEVRNFYRAVRDILGDALLSHVKRRFEEFRSYLSQQAALLPDRSVSEVQAEIDRASANIRTAAEAAIAGQKEAFERKASWLVAEISAANDDIRKLLEEAIEKEGSPDRTAAGVVSQEVARTVPAYLRLQEQATELLIRYVLRNGAKGWSFTRIFAPNFLSSATEAWLIDPYLALRHQRRNLNEFIAALRNEAKLKILHIVTRETTRDNPDIDKTFYLNLDRELFEKAGMKVTYTLDPAIHDRCFILDNGTVFKLGRGLDIYKAVAGLASGDPALRHARAAEIDVFGPGDDVPVSH